MGILHIRNVPDPLLARIRGLAAAASRSMGAEVVALLEAAVEDRSLQARLKGTLAKIRRHRWTPPRGAPRSVELLREDRDR